MGNIVYKHRIVDELGAGSCSVPMWIFGNPEGFCDAPAFGERPTSVTRTRWDGHVYRNDGRYAGYVPALACPMHGGPDFRLFMDGDAWCAVRAGFINLQESNVGFGETRDDAVTNLRKQERYAVDASGVKK